MNEPQTHSAPGIPWEPMLTYRDLEKLTRLTGRTILRLVTVHQFPRPVKIGKSSRWRREDVARFMEEQVQGPSGEAAQKLEGNVKK